MKRNLFEDGLFSAKTRFSSLRHQQVYLHLSTPDKPTYFLSCMKDMIEDLKRQFNDNFIYANLFNYDEKTDVFSSLLNNDIAREYLMSQVDIDSINLIDNARELVNSNHILSITKILIATNSINGVFFTSDTSLKKIYKSSIDDVNTLPDCIYYDFNHIDISLLNNMSIDDLKKNFKEALDKCTITDKSIDGFLKRVYEDTPISDKERIKTQKAVIAHCLYSYKYIANNEKIYVYFIRPRVGHKLYTGAMYLQLKEPLTLREYNEISAHLKNIFSETVMHKVREAERSEQHEKIMDELSHSSKHELLAMDLQQDEVISYLEAANSSAEVIWQAKLVSKRLKYLQEMTLYSLMLMKDGSETVLAQPIEPEKLPIKTQLLEALDSMEYSLVGLGLKPHHKASITTNCINSLKQDIENLPNMQVCVIKIGLYVILVDLFKNALFHTNSNNPKVEIYWEEHQATDEYRLCFKNNLPIKLNEVWRYIEFGEETTGYGKRFKGGISFIKRAINFRGFNHNNTKRWELHAIEPQKGVEHTIIYLSIPKQDVEFL